jgi:hypothetical protein
MKYQINHPEMVQPIIIHLQYGSQRKVLEDLGFSVVRKPPINIHRCQLFNKCGYVSIHDKCVKCTFHIPINDNRIFSGQFTEIRTNCTDFFKIKIINASDSKIFNGFDGVESYFLDDFLHVMEGLWRSLINSVETHVGWEEFKKSEHLTEIENSKPIQNGDSK